MAKIYVAVTPEQSSLIQQVYSSLGYAWLDGKDNSPLDIKSEDMSILVLDGDKKLFFYDYEYKSRRLNLGDKVYDFQTLMSFLKTIKDKKFSELEQKEMLSNLKNNGGCKADDAIPDILKTSTELKEGDKVYVWGSGSIGVKTIDKIEHNCAVFVGGGATRLELCCLATMENYQRLMEVFPKIAFEKPSQILKGSHATIHILKNQPRQICYVGDQSDFKCRSNDITELAVVVAYAPNSNRFLTDAGEVYAYAVPVDGNDNSIEIKV